MQNKASRFVRNPKASHLVRSLKLWWRVEGMLVSQIANHFIVPAFHVCVCLFVNRNKTDVRQLPQPDLDDFQLSVHRGDVQRSHGQSHRRSAQHQRVSRAQHNHQQGWHGRFLPRRPIAACSSATRVGRGSGCEVGSNAALRHVQPVRCQHYSSATSRP